MKTFFFAEDWHPSQPSAKDKIPKKYQKILHPWIQQFLDCSQKEAIELVEQRLNGVTEKFLLPIKKRLLKHKVYCVVCRAVSSDRAIAYLATGEEAWSGFYWPPPVDFQKASAHIDSIGLIGVIGLKEFVRVFDGIRDNPPGCSGDFECTKYMSALEDTRLFRNVKLEGQEPWKKAVPFYSASTGDTALVNGKGEIGWFCMETQRVKLRRGFFTDFVESYFKCEFNDSWDDPFVE